MNEDELRELLDETIATALQHAQSIVDIHINSLEDTWQKQDREFQKQSSETLVILVRLLMNVKDDIGAISPGFCRRVN